jgi:hypothetical protein
MRPSPKAGHELLAGHVQTNIKDDMIRGNDRDNS